MGIQRYLFFSIHNCQQHPNVPLMRIKSASEDFLQQSGVPYTIFRLCGFMQVRLVCLSCKGFEQAVRPCSAFPFGISVSRQPAERRALHHLPPLRLQAGASWLYELQGA